MPGTLFVVATPIGNLEDVTARALRVLREVALIAAEDTRRTAHLLARYGIPTKTVSLHEHNEAKKIPDLVARLKNGDQIALVSDAGTPTVSDPGRRLVTATIEAGIRIEPIPGPSAITAALAVSGFPADEFLFLGFPPSRASERAGWVERVKAAGRTVVFFEAPHRIVKTLQALVDSVGPECPVCVAREMTKRYEELVIGPIGLVQERLSLPLGEYTVVLDVGRLPQISRVARPDNRALLAELGALTANGGLSRREAIGVLAKRHDIRPNEVYEAIESAKK